MPGADRVTLWSEKNPVPSGLSFYTGGPGGRQDSGVYTRIAALKGPLQVRRTSLGLLDPGWLRGGLSISTPLAVGLSGIRLSAHLLPTSRTDIKPAVLGLLLLGTP